MFEFLNEEGAFPRLVQLIQTPKQNDEQVLHRMLMELLYEMARIQKISLEDLGKFTADDRACGHQTDVQS
jgi:nucleoid DNA-binding protein